MSTANIPFDFEEQAVRIVMRDDAPWFVAPDVCRVLEIGNPSQALARLDEDEVTLITNEGSRKGGVGIADTTLDTIEGIRRPTNVINESGLYALILTSRKPAAKRFRKWVTAEVLPALRSHGRYELPGGEPQMHEISVDRLIELLQAENQLLRTQQTLPKRKRKPVTPISDPERQKILRLIRAGLSLAQISRVTGRSQSAISLMRSGLRVIEGGK
ncbi:MAG: BRO family protein [Paracoccus sp. (in: a-proteobacteria)]|uniref:BRO family protein n=1 Tax=Paracoccus sp. TaxID=267 RepID=UPI0039E3FD16